MKTNYQSPAIIIYPLRDHSVICASQVDPSKGFTNSFDIDNEYNEME